MLLLLVLLLTANDSEDADQWIAQLSQRSDEIHQE